ncbi:MAG TPA: trypsin-like peptidase domain-containing protein [Longimicrobiales bacterium]|nr:trypsin-like peptidase domain-containing protein [Longimicrobiales bacterium]
MLQATSRNRLLAVTIIALLAGGGAVAGVALRPAGADRGPIQEAVRQAATLSDAFIAISEAVTGSVVQIEVVRLQMPPEPAMTGELRDLFNRPTAPRQAVPQVAGGSGFIVTQDGYILTNNHVIADADRITVTLRDRRSFDAELVGADPMTDVAVIRIRATSLPAVKLGDSDAARVGEWVLAVGNPGFADAGSTLDFTVTGGIISAKNRPLNILGSELDPGDANYAIEDFIQTDAVINPGNSGGPLVDLKGTVIGINTAIASTTGYSQGYGFAIPSNLAQRIMADLIEHGYVRRARLGVQITDVGAEDAEVYGLPSITGVVVEDFAERSPARESGLRRHDVIVAVDGQPVRRPGELQRLIALHQPFDVVPLSVVRYGKPLEIRARLMEAVDEAEPPARRSAAPRYPAGLGLEIQELTPGDARELGFERAGGALISRVLPGSAAESRIYPLHRIAEINGRAIDSVATARAILRAARPGQILSFVLQFPDGRSYIANVRVP